MTATSVPLLPPPPWAPGPAGLGGRREAAIAAVAPPSPPRAHRQADLASDRLGSGWPDPSVRPPATTRRQQPEGEERWRAAEMADRRSQGFGAPHAGLPFLAQQIAQEVLPSGLHREPWDVGPAAYRRAGGEPPLAPAHPTLVQLAV